MAVHVQEAGVWLGVAQSDRRRDSGHSARVEAVTDELRRAYAGWYERAVARGEVDPFVSPQLAARFLDTQISTVLLQMGLVQDPEIVGAQAQLGLRSLLRR